MTIQDLVDKQAAIIAARDARIVEQDARIALLSTELRRRIEEDREDELDAAKLLSGWAWPNSKDKDKIMAKYDQQMREWLGI
jgi:hypothetical protein